LKYYEQKLQDLNLIGCVHIHGFVEDIHNYLMKSRVVVLPSHRESFGRVLLEAFAYRRPIIATRVGGIPEIVDSTCGILIQPGDKNGLANAIRKLLDSDELTHQLGLAGYLKLTAKFSWTEYCRKVLKVHKY
jgi:glycosyltransferase involved in cell wall biosynthesis